MSSHQFGWLTGLVRFFVESKLTPLLIVASLLMGVFAVLNLPREEEPQISVPMFDVFVRYPGAGARDVEERIVNLGERKLWEIPGVEYIYSTAEAEQALFIVRFRVGEDPDRSAIKLYTKVFSNLDFLPQGASQPLIKIRSIDDVPVLAMTFHSTTRSPMEVRRIVASARQRLNALADVSETTIIGGRRRQFKVLFDEQQLAKRFLSPLELAGLIRDANIRRTVGRLAGGAELPVVEASSLFQSAQDLEQVVVGVSQGQPVYLRDVARVEDGPDEDERAVSIRFGPSTTRDAESSMPARGAEDPAAAGPFDAVTLAVSKRAGANATALCERLLHAVEEMRGTVIPEDVAMTVTRNYGETAAEKSNELLVHMGIAVIGVTLLIVWALGRYEAGVVAVAIPMTLALTLATFYCFGYTLNRITLFALIFSIGILVDDPIVDVENIVRHLRLPSNRNRNIIDVTIDAVNEVRSPLILATLTVIAAILPMAFVRGLMGPYMRPIPVGASAAMVFSMLVAFVATPWSAAHILGWAHRTGRLRGHGEGEREDALSRLYRGFMGPLIRSPRARNAFLWTLAGLLACAVLLVPLRLVLVKMLPFDNKNEFQVVLNMPEGTALSRTAAVADEMAAYLQGIDEVSDIETYAGTSAPYNFNGLVRHYFLRQQPHQAELQVNLAGKHHRKRQSHEIAEAVRPKIREISTRAGGRVQVAEVPPGPPVLSTMALEIYGPTMAGQVWLAERLQAVLASTAGITDVDTYVQRERPMRAVTVDRQKTTLNGLSASDITQTLDTALAGRVVDLAYLSEEPEPVEMLLRLPEEKRRTFGPALAIQLLSRVGQPIPLSAVTSSAEALRDRAIFHKNLLRVSYVLADVTDRIGSPVYAMLELRKAIAQLPLPDGAAAGKADVPHDGQRRIDQVFSRQPTDSSRWTIKWDGEWQVTYEVFRDLGLAFAAVLLLIYMLVVGWFRSFRTPWVVMLPIPLSLVGILPAHWMTGMFFTATSMIGLIAGAGIVVRNSIILVDFIELNLANGMPLEEAVIDAGIKRFRPMLLTASAVVVGASVLLFDPIFQGLALALIAGEAAATVLSRTAVPVAYYMMSRRRLEK